MSIFIHDESIRYYKACLRLGVHRRAVKQLEAVIAEKDPTRRRNARTMLVHRQNELHRYTHLKLELEKKVKKMYEIKPANLYRIGKELSENQF